MKLNPLLPGMALMRGMRLNAKMFTMGCLLMVPLLGVCWQLLAQRQGEIAFAEGERAGTAVLRPLLAVTTAIQSTEPSASAMASGLAEVATQLQGAAALRPWLVAGSTCRPVSSARHLGARRPRPWPTSAAWSPTCGN